MSIKCGPEARSPSDGRPLGWEGDAGRGRGGRRRDKEYATIIYSFPGLSLVSLGTP